MSQSRTLNGIEFQQVAAENIKARNATVRGRVVTSRSRETDRRYILGFGSHEVIHIDMTVKMK